MSSSCVVCCALDSRAFAHRHHGITSVAWWQQQLRRKHYQKCRRRRYVVSLLLYAEVQSTIASKFKFINCTNFGCHPDNRHDAWRTHTHIPAKTHYTIKWRRRECAAWTGIMKNSVTKENKLISLFKWIIKHWITSHLCGVLNTYIVRYFLLDFSTRAPNVERRTTMLIVLQTAFVRLLHDKWQWLSFIHLPRATHARRRITCPLLYTQKSFRVCACVRLCVFLVNK